MTIYFYHIDHPYGCFSNFSRHGFHLAGCYWPTAEHYYQAQKFINTGHAYLSQRIQLAPTPGEAAQIGRDPRHPLRPDWEKVKLEVMYAAIQAKFQTHSDIRGILLGTGEEDLVENSPVDSFWGCGANGNGSNHLGRLLMQLRQELRQENSP
ncbi:NADAR family protein [Synechococcus sp. PCC 6312]|uniref:NADAR family protein n=1 Tax=Synechococcus sp. (strain ATCC 27167 / PCC 6312) TaxID=195253 RepID=UPI00029F0AD4|nr:NADAR family protein [Synechococcus sp. PCC 6312]AFY59724.1 hypothetical protein Syn6312_0497 [Synechococcus sp. PCC 6312]